MADVIEAAAEPVAESVITYHMEYVPGSLPQVGFWVVVYVALYNIFRAALKDPRTAAKIVNRDEVTGKPTLDFTAGKQHLVAEKLVSMFHCVVCIPFALYITLTDPVTNANRFFAASSASMALLCFSTAYFVNDVLNMFRAKQPLLYCAHHVLSLFLYSLSVLSFMHYYGVIFLLFELSTPFLNVRGIMAILDRKSEKVYKINEIFFAVSFLGARVGFGVYTSWRFWVDALAIWPHTQGFGRVMIGVYMGCNVLFNALNFTWAWMIVKGIIRKIQSANK